MIPTRRHTCLERAQELFGLIPRDLASARPQASGQAIFSQLMSESCGDVEASRHNRENASDRTKARDGLCIVLISKDRSLRRET